MSWRAEEERKESSSRLSAECRACCGTQSQDHQCILLFIIKCLGRDFVSLGVSPEMERTTRERVKSCTKKIIGKILDGVRE